MLEWEEEAETVLFTGRWKDIQSRAETTPSLTPGCGPRRVEHIAPIRYVMGSAKMGKCLLPLGTAQSMVQRGLVSTGGLSSCSALRICLSLRAGAFCKMQPLLEVTPQAFSVKWS